MHTKKMERPPELGGVARSAHKKLGEILVGWEDATEAQVAAALKEQAEGDPRHIGELLVAAKVVSPERIRDALLFQRGEAREA